MAGDRNGEAGGGVSVRGGGAFRPKSDDVAGVEGGLGANKLPEAAGGPGGV